MRERRVGVSIYQVASFPSFCPDLRQLLATELSQEAGWGLGMKCEYIGSMGGVCVSVSLSVCVSLCINVCVCASSYNGKLSLGLTCGGRPTPPC